jgi:cobalt-zinc-cadmium efflux system outer membrane protein
MSTAMGRILGKSKHVLRVVTVVGLMAFRLSAQAPSGPLTLSQVIEVARAKNPTLLQLDRNLQGVKAQEIQAGVRANPNLTFYGTNVTLPAEGASNPYAYSFQVSRLFERGDKRRWRLDVAKATTEQTAAQLKDQERQTILNVKQAFTNMMIAKAALKLAQENLGDFKKQLDIHRERYEAGDIGKLDFERLDLQMAQFESDASTATINLAQASDQLQTLMGYERPTAAFDIAGEIVPPALNAALSDLQQKALDLRPDLKAAEAGMRAADANVKLAYANGTTDPTLEGEYDRSGTYNSAGFSISIPLRLFDRNQGNKLTAKFQADASSFAVTASHNQIISDVDQAWVQYTNAKAISERYSGHYVDEAKDTLSIAQFAYQQGGLALIDYLNALQENRTTALNALNAYSATWMAIHQLGYVTGTEVLP